MSDKLNDVPQWIAGLGEWRWKMIDYYSGYFDVAVTIHHPDAPGEPYTSGVSSLRLDHKPTPSDHARARCIAALLLAAKIGE